MRTEEKLKNYIISKHGSVRKFAPLTGLPYSTIQSILRRGIENCNVQNIQQICDALNISSTDLLNGIIKEKPMNPDISIFVESTDVGNYVDHFVSELLTTMEPLPKKEFTLDGARLNKRDVTFIKHYLNMMMNALREERKNDEDKEE
ncbi:MAG: helix-turn-helix transcriptional regulator [Methanobrevibacter sp.]|nr:helix-turn-helix transcriptional regulator [Methanobrevibacter sp.]